MLDDSPRSARIEEYDELMRLLERSYDKIRELFQDHYPQVWKRENVKINNCFVIKKDGKMLSHVGLMPFDIISDNKIIKVAGIGGVATDPVARGAGYMGTLLKYAITQMKKQGFPISVLWGMRSRYANYGWDYTGSNLITTLTKYDLEKIKPVQVELKKYTEAGHFGKIIETYEKEPLRVNRSKKTFKLLFERPGQETWITDGNEGFAYIVISGAGNERSVLERGGSPQAFLSLCFEIMKKTNSESLRVVSSARHTPITETLLRTNGGCSWSQIEPLCMLKILDLDKTLEAFGVKTGSFKFTMTDESEKKFVGIKINGNEIKLPQTAMARLLFGPLKPSQYFSIEPDIAKELDKIFPLEFHIGQMDYI